VIWVRKDLFEQVVIFDMHVCEYDKLKKFFQAMAILSQYITLTR